LVDGLFIDSLGLARSIGGRQSKGGLDLSLRSVGRALHRCESDDSPSVTVPGLRTAPLTPVG